jgi:hypothetical protein
LAEYKDSNAFSLQSGYPALLGAYTICIPEKFESSGMDQWKKEYFQSH